MAASKNPWFDNASNVAFAFKETGAQPLDIRCAVNAREDLIEPKTFTTDYTTPSDTNKTYYKGMIVAVIADGSLWVLKGDTPWVGSATQPEAGDYSNWQRVLSDGEGAKWENE